MKKYKTIILAALFVMVANCVLAQNLVWSVDFKTQFDNREYGVSPIVKSQTLFGARLTPQIGVQWGNNKLIAGTNAIIEFGARPFDLNPDLLLYYAYDTQKYKAYVGSFPRTKMMGQFSTAFFNDSIKFYDNNLEGMLLQYVGKRGFFEIGVDWNSRIDHNVREKFMIFSAGQIRRGLFYAGYDLTVYHHAGSTEVDGVVDNILTKPYIGINLSNKIFLDSLTIQLGYLQALQNDRRYGNGYIKPGGTVIDITVEKFRVGIHNMLYLGKNGGHDIMPFYSNYGTGLYSGDRYYSTDGNVYDRLELYWQAVKRRDINLKISSVHHYDGDVWGWQQLLTFSVNLNRGTFKRSPAK